MSTPRSGAASGEAAVELAVLLQDFSGHLVEGRIFSHEPVLQNSGCKRLGGDVQRLGAFAKPLLFLRRDTRLAGTVVALQLAGYLLRYFTASFDFRFSVLSSFPRLIFHVLPAVAIALAAVAGAWRARKFSRSQAALREAATD